jgi:hypothetical protein
MDFGTRVARPLAINAIIHLLICGAGIALLHYYVAGPHILDPGLLSQLTTNSFGSIDYYVQDGIKSAEVWAIYLALASFVVSSIWIVSANLRDASGADHARSRLGAWFFGLLLLVATGSAVSWWIFLHKHVAANLSERFMTPLMIVGAIAALIAYYLGTALGAKPLMRRSVPFADVWLS